MNTANEKRDAHLRNEDFFNTAKFPKIIFKSTQMEKVGDKKYKFKIAFDSKVLNRVRKDLFTYYKNHIKERSEKVKKLKI